jgi:hypothetical protein
VTDYSEPIPKIEKVAGVPLGVPGTLTDDQAVFANTDPG